MTETAATAPDPAAQRAFAAQRVNMVDSQVRPSDISDRRIIRAMGQVPREQFVPASQRTIAYMDNPIVLVRGVGARTLVEPRLFAKLVQAASIPDGGRVLEVGCGTGYGVAVLAAMGLTAFGLEADADLAAAATAALGTVGIANGVDPTIKQPIVKAPVVKVGALVSGLPDDGPFDAILLAGSVSDVPSALFDQLKSGGRLVAVIGSGPDGKASVWTRSGQSFAARDAFDAAAAPLPGFSRPAIFAL